METRIEPIASFAPSREEIQAAVELLRKGGIVAFPTETVYGLGAAVRHQKALSRLYEIKGRPRAKPLQVMVAEESMIHEVAKEIPETAYRIMKRFWPGPLTLVLPARPELSSTITAGTRTVGIRFPDHPVPLSLMRELGQPLAASSANLSGLPAPADAQAVLLQLRGKIPLILDGGSCPGGRESTVLDCTGEIARILRPGAVPVKAIREVAPCA